MVSIQNKPIWNQSSWKFLFFPLPGVLPDWDGGGGCNGSRGGGLPVFPWAGGLGGDGDGAQGGNPVTPDGGGGGGDGSHGGGRGGLPVLPRSRGGGRDRGDGGGGGGGLPILPGGGRGRGGDRSDGGGGSGLPIFPVPGCGRLVRTVRDSRLAGGDSYINRVGNGDTCGSNSNDAGNGDGGTHFEFVWGG